MRFVDSTDPMDADLPDAGSLLVAHPTMLDPNFSKAVVFLTVHSPSEGSLGVIVNRPLMKTLGEFDPAITSSLADIPLYEGGPVAPDKLILAAWKWIPGDGTFKLYFGIDGEKAEKLLVEDPEFEVRGFMGHSGWSGGQLEDELSEGAWVLSKWLPELGEKEGVDVWRSILCHEDPTMKLFTDIPDDPSLN